MDRTDFRRAYEILTSKAEGGENQKLTTWVALDRELHDLLQDQKVARYVDILNRLSPPLMHDEDVRLYNLLHIWLYHTDVTPQDERRGGEQP